MAIDDRDRNFEKALARQLRSSASSGENANALSGAPAEPLAELCPDPEMLAAYHDGSLSLEERNLWKPHVLSCERCQLVLAHLETPLEVPASLETKEKVLVPQQPVSSGETTSPARVARPSFLHSLRWLWLVPAGAVAAGLVAWISLQTPKPTPLAPPSSVEIAENRQPLAAAPSAAPALTAPIDSKVSKEKMQTAASAVGAVAGRPAAPTTDLASNESQNQLQALPRIQSQNSRNTAHGPFLNQQKQEQQIGQIAAGSAGGLVQKKLDTQATPSAGDRVPEVLHLNALPPPPPASPASSEPSFLDSGSVSAPLKDKTPPAPAPKPAPAASSGAAAPQSQASSADAISSITETVEVSEAPQSARNGRAMMRAAALQNPHVIAAPGEQQLWRIGPAGSLEHSKDKGLTWIPQISGVYTDLLAGSAPSAKVCWIVGASGTVLRTTDGGTHWSKLDSPITNSLTGVRAMDATHATIWFVPDPQTAVIKSYQTADGGVTWSALSTQ
jgi:hypothetical protein